MKGELEKIHERLKHLERQNCIIKRCAIIISCILGALILMGQAISNVVKQEVSAQRFILVDDEGTVYASLEFSSKGSPRFLLHNGKNASVSLHAEENSAGLGLSANFADSIEHGTFSGLSVGRSGGRVWLETVLEDRKGGGFQVKTDQNSPMSGEVNLSLYQGWDKNYSPNVNIGVTPNGAAAVQVSSQKGMRELRAP